MLTYESQGRHLADATREAANADGCETRRVREFGDLVEVRVRKRPGFGMKLSVDVELDAVQAEPVVPANPGHSRVGADVIEMLNIEDEDATGLAEAIGEEEFDRLASHLAVGSEASKDAIRQSLREFGHCTEVYRSEHGGGVATFEAYF